MKQLIVPLAILVMLGSIVIPLPSSVLSLFLVLNLLAAVLLLASSLYVSEPLKLSALPSLLLVLTLFRLALNVSTTRLILSVGDAGAVVEAFGKVVIQGRLGVGIVVFLVMSLVQFIVVAKGAERVAEVSARFTLDALPGKQMAIDADLRAGVIDSTMARFRREELQTESRFYGALDGAMKFVKGDAIAGLAIVFVNFTGGIVSGLVVDNLSLTQALAKYSNLTIGDGLLTQIPSLMNAIAAGLIVTRVTRSDKKSLSLELLEQISGEPIVRVICSACLLFIALVPGFPRAPFLLVAVVLLISALVGSCKAQRVNRSVVIELLPRQLPLLELSGIHKYSDTNIAQILQQVRNTFYEETGILLPQIALSTAGEKIDLRMRGVLVASTNNDAEQLSDFLYQALFKFAPELVDDLLTQRLIDFYDRHFPELISTVVPSLATVTQITEILRQLVTEKISIRNFDVILQVIAEKATKCSDEHKLLEQVRFGLRRTISERFAGVDGKVRAIHLSPETELLLIESAKVSQHFDNNILEALKSGLATVKDKDAVIVVSRQTRRRVRDYLDFQAIDRAVLAYDEIMPPAECLQVAEIVAPKQQELLLQRLAA